MDMTQYKKIWDLSPLLNGAGGSYEKIAAALKRIKKEMGALTIQLPEILDPYQRLSDELSEAGTLILCLTSQDVTDSKAAALEADHTALCSDFNAISLKLDQILLAFSDHDFAALLKKVPDLAFPLTEKRILAKEKMSLDKEELVNALSISGHNSFTTLYYTTIGLLKFPVEDETLNLSKVENVLTDKKRSRRKAAHDSMESTLTGQEPLFGQYLNSILDFRLRLNEARGHTNYLHDTLRQNRMSEKTLRTMWDVMDQNKGFLVRYLNRKAELLNLDKLAWYDIDAPIGDFDATIPWETGCDTVIEQFKTLSPKMSAFAKKAIEEGWIHAELSPVKRSGGYCTSAPLLKESRILLNWADSFTSQGTHAHELGHAFHSHVIFDLPPLLRSYPMNLAESASTMCEMIVADGAFKAATSKEEKLSLLEDKISRYVAFGMNIHSRFIFECWLHEERPKGFLTPDRITALMLKAQKAAYKDALSEYFPHFWCYKMHFYFTDTSFYNWSYTFGYLFSAGLYNELSKDPAHFEERYIALLRDTGRLSVEELAQKHLNIDLGQPAFWQATCDHLNRDIEAFLDLSRN